MKFLDACRQVIKSGKEFRAQCEQEKLSNTKIRTLGRELADMIWLPMLASSFPKEETHILFLCSGFATLRKHLECHYLSWCKSGKSGIVSRFRINTMLGSCGKNFERVFVGWTKKPEKMPDYVAFIGSECIYCVVPYHRLEQTMQEYATLDELCRFDVMQHTTTLKSVHAFQILPEGYNEICKRKLFLKCASLSENAFFSNWKDYISYKQNLAKVKKMYPTILRPLFPGELVPDSDYVRLCFQKKRGKFSSFVDIEIQNLEGPQVYALVDFDGNLFCPTYLDEDQHNTFPRDIMQFIERHPQVGETCDAHENGAIVHKTIVYKLVD